MRPSWIRGRDGRNYSRWGYRNRFGSRIGGHWGYRGRFHRHWSRCWFSPRWGAWTYFDPACCGWYYWSGSCNAYMPVDAMSEFPPDGSDADPEAFDDEIPSINEDEEIPDLPNAP